MNGELHLAAPALLCAVLAGLGVYGMLARRSTILVLISAELILNAAAVLLVGASRLPAGGLAADPAGAAAASAVAEPLLSGQMMTLFIITLAAAEVGLALAIVLLIFRTRAVSDLDELTELGEAR